MYVDEHVPRVGPGCSSGYARTRQPEDACSELSRDKRASEDQGRLPTSALGGEVPSRVTLKVRTVALIPGVGFPGR